MGLLQTYNPIASQVVATEGLGIFAQPSVLHFRSFGKLPALSPASPHLKLKL